MNIQNAVKEGSQILKFFKSKTPLLDSEILMSKAIKENRSNVLLNPNRILSNQDYENFRELISNRLQFKPIAYLTGKKSFWKHEFEINDKVLIPRKDTELIIAILHTDDLK